LELDRVRASEYNLLHASLVVPNGRSVNIAWPTSGFGDGDYIYAFQKIVMPIAYEFNPDLVISEYRSIAGQQRGLISSFGRFRRCGR
jgi:hypothetical protein